MNNEIWKFIDDSENYKISNMGKVMSNKKSADFKILKGNHTTQGYIVVGLQVQNKLKIIRVNRLVAKLFISNPNNYEIVDHINGNRMDNRVENLRWVSCSQNCLNSGIQSNNSSGVKGVYFCKTFEKWIAHWQENGKTKSKYCETKDDAIQYRKQKVNEHYNLEYYSERTDQQFLFTKESRVIFTNNELEKEIWKELEKSNGKYFVSNLGFIKSFVINKINGLILKCNFNSEYLVSTLNYEGNPKEYRIHVLVAKTFIQNPNNYNIVDHINGNKTDNRVENLRWVSHHQNSLNTNIAKDNTSGIKGVSFDTSKTTKPWSAMWIENGRRKKQTFETKEEASFCRNQMVELYYSKEHYKDK